MSTPITDVFEQKGWSFEFINTLDVNSNLIIDRINQLKFDFVIFSGYGGQILKQNHFETNMPYLHMHPGSLPEERGSTTIYYSILNQKKCTVTAFLMTDQIDSGKIILKHEYEIPPRGTNIDTWFDNIVRADCLCRAVHILKTNHLLKFDNKNGNTVSEEYYIIHPVLKHIALLSM
ncbi:MAG: hypothetical protein H6606_10970 [Flavobacteriales bacterium]|nr:hypothetical protein [Flavobacteriales bacterium]